MSLKEKYIETTKEQIEKWKADIDVIKAKIDKAGAETRAGYHQKVQNAEKQVAHAEVKLGELKDASEHSWDDLKTGFEKVFNEVRSDLKETIEHAQTDFK